MQDILSLNALQQSENGVFVTADQMQQPFAYSDGAETEQYLYQVLSQADDLGSRSTELQRAIHDWPSEYHLSSDRSNLLRPFDLSGVKSVLELGSGCGAISRYLGEQGFTVDAVEGSPIRAGLGRLRCRDLDNVRIINANYNNLQFPTDHYDLVLFVGVIEYARKFHPDAASDRDAAIKILSQANSFINSRGAVCVAIENRLGLKYVLGAHEDHYARKYVGVNDYVESAGIATYSRPQWDQLIVDAGFSCQAVSYPFPDYKIPSVVLAEDYAATNAYSSNHLEGMVSRDYYAPVDRTPTEMIGWQAASQGQFLGDVANSFCLLMGNNQLTLDKMQSFDFCHGPGRGRDNRFAVSTIKPRGSSAVEKHRVADTKGSFEREGITQHLVSQDLIAGNLLSGQWLRTLLIYVRRDEFDRELQKYFSFLQQQAQSGTLAIDLLPINIIVCPVGEWQVFDQEWQVEWQINEEYVLFRALLTFIVSNWVYLRDFLSWLELQTVEGFIEYGFHANKIELSEHLELFIELENRFQRGIARDPKSQDVTTLLATVFDFSPDDERVYSSIHWSEDGENFSGQTKTEKEIILSPEACVYHFDIKPNQSLAALRFDPFDLRRAEGIGFFRLQQIAIEQLTEGKTNTLWSLSSSEAIANNCLPDSVKLSDDCWIAITDFPKLIFRLQKPIAILPGAEYQVSVRYAVIRTPEYAMAYKNYLVETRSQQKRINRMGLNIIWLKDLSTYLDAKVNAEEKRANRLQKDLDNTIDEVEAIKQSRAFKIGLRIVNLAASMRRLVGK